MGQAPATGRLGQMVAQLRQQPMVRTWALAGPVVIALIAVPLLRPLRQPDEQRISHNEASRLATIDSLVHRGTLAIDGSVYGWSRETAQFGERRYSRQPPMLALLLAGPYWLMTRAGLTLQSDPTSCVFLLTLIAATLPAMFSAALMYRMARMFELRRQVRAALALAVVLGSGMISYATVLNAHVPAAMLLLAACACFFHMEIVQKQRHSWAWLALAGLCAGLAATIDLPAVAFLALFAAVILAMRWPIPLRLGGVLLYLAGALPPLVVHAALVVPLTGDLGPGLHPPPTAAGATPSDDEEPGALVKYGWRTFDALVGPHGLLSHFPVLAMGLLGIGAVMHRNWPTATKALALATVAGSAVVLAAFILLRADWTQPMFAARWFVLFTPALLFWAGAWLRRPHRPHSWAIAAALLAWSIAVSVVGANNPFVPARPGHHTALEILRQMRQTAAVDAVGRAGR
mgnify:CR=1 FL=1